MSFSAHSQKLKDFFTDILARRPKDIIRAGGTPAIVQAGGNENFALSGKYLEGASNSDISLYSSSDRILFQDIQKSGTFEDTQVNAVINASAGADLNNISVHGYTWGLDGNETAKFNVNNAINIEDSEPTLDSVNGYMINAQYPEAIKFVCTASPEVVSILMTVEGKVLEYSGLEFIYTFTVSGWHTVTFQGRTETGELTNQITKNVPVAYRPSITGMNIRARYEDYAQFQGYAVPFWYGLTGEYVGSPWRAGYYARVVDVQMSYTPEAGFFPANFDITLYYNQGGLVYPISYPVYFMMNTGGVAVGTTTLNQSVIKLSIVPRQLSSYYDYVYLIFYPTNTAGTIGAPMEVCFRCWTYNGLVAMTNPDQQPPAPSYPSTTLTGIIYNPSAALQFVTGSIVSQNYYEDNVAPANLLTSVF